MLSLILAHDTKFGIGKSNSLPWKLKKEIRYFKSITTKNHNCYPVNESYLNAVIMGRKTWESIPLKFRPLTDRLNIILSRNKNYNLQQNDKLIPFTFFADSLDEGIEFAKNYIPNILMQKLGHIFIIGGASLYREAFTRTELQNIYITQIYHDFQADTFLTTKEEFPKLIEKFNISTVSSFKEEDGIYFRYFKYQHCNIKPDLYGENGIVFKNKEEQQYLDILYKIGLYGIKREDRTAIGTISTFGEVQKFNLRDTFPLLTTKRMFFKAIFEELMLYLRGQTDNKILQKKNIHIWDGNTSRKFLDNRGLEHYEEGDMGETYGFNFRHYGGNYQGCSNTYEKGRDGFDQLQNVIHLIKNNPTSRRIIINLWNPYTEHKASLPSCLCWYQFYVNTYEKTLSLIINIRSSDFFLANNWNVCTGALFVNLLCNLEDIDLTPGDLTVVSGDTHIYLTHLEQVRENLERTPRPFPKLIVKSTKNIENYHFHDVKLIGYNPYPNLKAPMAI